MKNLDKVISLKIDKDVYDKMNKLTRFKHEYNNNSHFMRLAIIEKVDREFSEVDTLEIPEECEKTKTEEFDF